MNISVVFVCIVFLLCCVHSEATNCTEPVALTRCPTRPICYCYDGSRIKFLKCSNGQLQQQNCGCPSLPIANVLYTKGSKVGHSYTVYTVAQYTSFSTRHTCFCTVRGWTGGQNDPQCAKLLVTPTPEHTTPTPVIKTCPKIIINKVKMPFFGEISYQPPSEVNGRYPVYTTAYYHCEHGSDVKFYRVCTENGWDLPHSHGVEATPTACSCSFPDKLKNLKVDFRPDYTKNGRYRIGTTATCYCRDTHYGSKRKIGTVTCTKSGKWTNLPGRSIYSVDGNCLIPVGRTTSRRVRTTLPIKDTEVPSHHNDERTLVIVSGTTGAILGALIILVVVVSCQRRLHYHRLRRARLRHRQDQDAFTAFITYHRDARMMLPSYDEAMNQREHGQPPSFEEALEHYEEPSLPPDYPPASDSPPSFTPRESPTSTTSPVSSETRNSPEEDATPTGNTRFIRSLRALFGGRAFRTDAIYCRFVPQEDENESDQNVDRDSRNSPEGEDADDAQLSEVLARAGLC